MSYTEEARKLLATLRDGCRNIAYEVVLVDLNRKLALGGIKPVDIGTSQEEIEQLTHKAMAIRRLQQLRTGMNGNERSPDVSIELLKQELEKGGYSLCDIGTTQEELDELRFQCWKGAAEYYLHIMRDSGHYHHLLCFGYDITIGCLREALTKIGFSLSDIGISEEEIEKLGKDAKEERWRNEQESLREYNAWIDRTNKERLEKGLS